MLATRRDDVLELRINRPERRNALDRAVVQALLDYVPDPAARVVILGSADPRAFSAGADLTLSDAERAEVSELLYELYRRMIELPVPIIAVLQGAAVGGGAQIAVAADLRIADPKARLRFVGPGHGLAVGAWALQSLLGRGRAMDLCLTMRFIDAGEALRLGLIERVVADPWTAARETASQIAHLDDAAVGRVKQILCTGAGLASSLDDERRGNRAAWDGSMTMSSELGRRG